MYHLPNNCSTCKFFCSSKIFDGKTYCVNREITDTNDGCGYWEEINGSNYNR